MRHWFVVGCCRWEGGRAILPAGGLRGNQFRFRSPLGEDSLYRFLTEVGGGGGLAMLSSIIGYTLRGQGECTQELMFPQSYTTPSTPS